MKEKTPTNKQDLSQITVTIKGKKHTIPLRYAYIYDLEGNVKAVYCLGRLNKTTTVVSKSRLSVEDLGKTDTKRIGREVAFKRFSNAIKDKARHLNNAEIHDLFELVTKNRELVSEIKYAFSLLKHRFGSKAYYRHVRSLVNRNTFYAR